MFLGSQTKKDYYIIRDSYRVKNIYWNRMYVHIKSDIKIEERESIPVIMTLQKLINESQHIKFTIFSVHFLSLYQFRDTAKIWRHGL